MSLTTRAAVKVSMRIAATDTSKDNLIDTLIGSVDSLIKNWCGRNLEKVLACSAPSGVAAALAAGGSLSAGTYYYVITSLNLNGETTASSEVSATTASTNLTIALSWGQVNAATGYKIYRGTSAGAQNKLVATIPAGSVVNWSDTGVTGDTATVPTSNTATAGQTEYLDGNNQMQIRVREVPIKVSELTAVYVDPTGYYGQGSGAFAAATLQTAGTDYFLRVDQPDGVTSRSGIIERVSGVWSGTVVRDGGRLSSSPSFGRGNIKVTHTAGYAPGAVPPEISNQANMMIARMIKIGAAGILASSESFEDRSISIDLGPYHSMLFTTEAVGALLPYRRLTA